MTLNAIIANFQTFKIVDLLDIIIIAFLIYQLLCRDLFFLFALRGTTGKS